MKTVLNYPCSKQMIKDWVLSYIPKHVVYVEPYFGSGSIFFDKDKAKIEVINDIDQDVYNYFKVIRDNPNEIIEQIMFTPFSIEEYHNSRIINEHDNEDVFIYCDPPYVLSTRKEHLYNYDMTDEQHIELLEVLKRHKGKILISGYDNKLYNKMLKNWHKETIVTSSERGKRIECLWMNY